MEQKYIVAFEIGSSSIKGAVGTTTGDSGHVNILAIAEEPLHDKVRFGIVENPGDVAACVSVIARRLQQASGVSPRTIREAYVGISGRSVASLPRTVNREFHAEMEVTERVINDLLDEAIEAPIGDKIVVDVKPVSFSVDGSAKTAPVGIFGHSVAAKVNLITCKPKMKNNIDRVFHDRCGINIAGYIVTPLAIAEQVLTTEERRLGVMLADFGAETTTVVIYSNGVPQYLSTIPIGSRNITLDLTSLNCLEERAEEIKKVVGDAMPQAGAHSMMTDDLDNTSINNIVAARADEIVSNIIEHITYAGFKVSQLSEGIVVCGGGARLRNLVDLLGKRAKMKTRMATPGSAVTLSTHDISPTHSLDVISLVAAAASRPAAVVECTEMPQGIFASPADPPAYDPYSHATPSAPEQHTGVDENDISRIGSYDHADDDVLADDFVDEPRRSKPAKAPKPPKTPKPAKEPKAPKDPSRGWWNILADKVTKMMAEAEDEEEE